MPDSFCPQHIFDKIALSCSGGGYRAASYHLGTLAYLHHLDWKGSPLLHRVKMISTVSGGTLTGMLYALHLQEGKSFGEFYDFLIDRLHRFDLLRESIHKLSPAGNWSNPHKTRNLINAFAEIYNEQYTFSKTLLEFQHFDSHLEAVVFNSTEFKNGLNFRFRNSGKLTGNARIRVPSERAREIRLADIIAASSCFPGGFEPMLWPHDFVHDQSPNLAALANEKRPLGIMDGGIYDNQGLDSILQYKKGESPYFDLVIVSDVSSPYMAPFAPAPLNLKGVMHWTAAGVVKTYKLWQTILWAVVVMLFLLPLAWGYTPVLRTGLSIGLAVPIILFLIAQSILLRKIKIKGENLLRRLIGSNYSFYRSKLKPLAVEKVPFGKLSQLAQDRINSLSVLLQDVFLKVVRRANYNQLYEDSRYHLRRITTLIRSLDPGEFKRYRRFIDRKNPPVYTDFAGPDIEKVIKAASSFGTTLWFTEAEQLDDMLRSLVSAGKISMCFQMMIYLQKWVDDDTGAFDRLSREDQAGVRRMLEQCRNDWQRFRKDPHWLSQ